MLDKSDSGSCSKQKCRICSNCRFKRCFSRRYNQSHNSGLLSFACNMHIVSFNKRLQDVTHSVHGLVILLIKQLHQNLWLEHQRLKTQTHIVLFLQTQESKETFYMHCVSFHSTRYCLNRIASRCLLEALVSLHPMVNVICAWDGVQRDGNWWERGRGSCGAEALWRPAVRGADLHKQPCAGIQKSHSWMWLYYCTPWSAQTKNQGHDETRQEVRRGPVFRTSDLTSSECITFNLPK